MAELVPLPEPTTPEPTTPGDLISMVIANLEDSEQLLNRLGNTNTDRICNATQEKARQLRQLVTRVYHRIELTRKSRSARRAPAHGRGAGGDAIENSGGDSTIPQVSDIEDKDIVIGHARFAEKLKRWSGTHIVRETEFFSMLFSMDDHSRAYRVSEGLRFVVSKIGEYHPKTLEQYLFEGSNEYLTGVIEKHLDCGIDDMTDGELHWTYYAFEHKKGIFNRILVHTLFENCAMALIAIRFALYWRTMDQDPNPQTRKEQAIQDTYQRYRNLPLTVNPATFEKEVEYQRFKSSFRDFGESVERFLTGYEVLGSIVLISPLLDFKSFKDLVVGPKLNAIIPTVDNLLAQNHEFRKHQESLVRDMIEDIYRILPSSRHLLQCLRDIESVSLVNVRAYH
ncbi:unnamed protein product [Rhizoctonia solani]|uniref:Uncharacterized protein n=1 Tax=Rhizoctonia solani TaxID=456999 RepID=A0A8H3C4G4_9AGAM|nr:unnamed protein product [Rhizoctonia solani]